MMEHSSPSAPRPVLPPPSSLFAIEQDSTPLAGRRLSSVLPPKAPHSESSSSGRRSIGHAYHHAALPGPSNQSFYNSGNPSNWIPRSYHPHEESLNPRSSLMNVDPARKSRNDFSTANQPPSLARNASTSSRSSSDLLHSLPQMGSYPSEHPVLSRPGLSPLAHEKSRSLIDNNFRHFPHAPPTQSAVPHPHPHPRAQAQAQSQSQAQSNPIYSQLPQNSTQNFRSWRPSGLNSGASTMKPPIPSPMPAPSLGSRSTTTTAPSEYTGKVMMGALANSTTGSAPSPVPREPTLKHDPALVKSSTSPPTGPRSSNLSPKQHNSPELGVDGSDFQFRKRIRVDRACDECRRKKSKCSILGAFPGEPAFDEASEELKAEASQNDWGMIILSPCTNCQRSGIKCAYTKKSVKKAPGKGYIKELEKRLDHLENVALPNPTPASAPSSTPVSKSVPSKSSPEGAEDRIARLESVIGDPEKKTTEVDPEKKTEVTSVSKGSSQFSPDRRGVKRNRDETSLSTEESHVFSMGRQLSSHSRNVGGFNSNPSQRLKAIESASHIKKSYLSTSIQGTFPIVHFDSVESARSLVGLDEKPRLRGMKLLLDPIERPASSNSTNQFNRSDSVSGSGSPFGVNGSSGLTSPAFHGGSGLKLKSHLSKQMNLFAQASRGFSTIAGGPSSSFSSRLKKQNSSSGAIRAGRSLAHMKAGLEADSLLFCYLDSLRRGQGNHSALAVAVSKLGGIRNSAMDRDSEPATLRRRTVMMMMDRWHCLAFGTAPVLTGRLALEDQSLSTLISSLGSTEGSAVGEGVNEILRAARIFSQLQDLVENYGWKSANEAELKAIFERNADDDSTQSGNPSFPPSQAEVDVSSLVAFRMSLTGCIRTYHCLNVISFSSSPNSSIKEVSRLFDLAESVIVLGTTKRSLNQTSILFKTMIAPHVLSMAAVAFSFMLRSLVLFVKRLEPTSNGDGLASRNLKEELQRLEHYRRKSTDYIKLITMLTPLSGGESLISPASFQPLTIKLQLFCHSNLDYSNSLGDLVKYQSQLMTPSLKQNSNPDSEGVDYAASPLGQSYQEISKESDDFLELIRDCGSLGLVLSSVDDEAVWDASSESLHYEGVGFASLSDQE